MRLIGKKILVTGADGFIGSHLTEAPGRAGRRCARLRLLQLLQLLGLARRCATRRQALARRVRRRHPRSARRAHGDARLRRRAAPGGADRDPVFVPLARHLRRHQRQGHAERRAGRARARRRTGRAHLDQRGLRHRALRADHRGAPAAGPVALLGDQDRRRPDRASLPPVVRHAGDGDPAVQHLRPAAVGARGDPDDHHADRRRRAHRSSSARCTRRATSTSCATRCAASSPSPECDAAIGEVINIGSNFEISIGDTARTDRRGDGRRRSRSTATSSACAPPESEVERLWADNTRAASWPAGRPSTPASRRAAPRLGRDRSTGSAIRTTCAATRPGCYNI